VFRLNIHKQPYYGGYTERHAHRMDIIAVRFDDLGFSRPDHNNGSSGRTDGKRLIIVIQKKNLTVKHIIPPGPWSLPSTAFYPVLIRFYLKIFIT